MERYPPFAGARGGYRRLIKTEFSRTLPHRTDAHVDRRKGERGIWQRRFWEHLIRDERDFDAHIGYIHFNPVKHGYVAEMDHWPHSSWHRFKEEHGGILRSSPDGFEGEGGWRAKRDIRRDRRMERHPP